MLEELKKGQLMKSAETSQPEFLRLLKQRDKDAWLRFYASSITRLYNFIYYKLHRDQHAAEEVTQETYLNAYASVERYSREKGEVESWLTGIASNQVRSFLRRSRRRKMETLGGAGDNLSIPNQPPSPEELLANQEVIDSVNAAIAELPERYGTVLRMKYMARMSVREIAGKIESTEKAAERLLSRARGALKRSLAPSQATLTGVVFVSAQDLLESNLQLLLAKGYKPVAPREVFRRTLEKNLLSSIKKGAEMASTKSAAATVSRSIIKPLVIGGTVAVLVLMSVLLIRRAGDVAAPKGRLPSAGTDSMRAGVANRKEQDSPAGEIPGQPEKTAGEQAAAAPGSETKEDKQKPQGLPDVNEWEILEGLAERLYKMRVTFTFSEPSLKDAVGFLRDITGINFVISEEIPEVDNLLLSTRLTDVPLVKVLEAICLASGLDYGLFTSDDGVASVLLSTLEDITKRNLEKPDSFIETIDCSAIKAKLRGRSCPFGLIEEELQRVQAIEKKLKEKVKFDKPITTFGEVREFFENSGIPIVSSKELMLKLSDTAKVETGPNEISLFQVFRRIARTSGLDFVLSPDGVVFVSSRNYSAMYWYAYQQQPPMKHLLENQTVTLDFTDTPVKGAISSLHGKSKLNYALSPAARKKVENAKITLQATEIQLQDALAELCRQADLTYEVKGFFILIKTLSEK
jgi:RNA polymerase sigma-70 factor (ECF subfamily)